jgi:hypothetical protein
LLTKMSIFPNALICLRHCALDFCRIGIVGRYCSRSVPASNDGIYDCAGPFR